MKNVVQTLVIVTCVMVLVTWFNRSPAASFSPVYTPVQEIQGGLRPVYPRWQYKNVPRNFDEEFSEKTLNKHGKEGWELVIIYEDKETAVFKRPLR